MPETCQGHQAEHLKGVLGFNLRDASGLLLRPGVARTIQDSKAVVSTRTRAEARQHLEATTRGELSDILISSIGSNGRGWSKIRRPVVTRLIAPA